MKTIATTPRTMSAWLSNLLTIPGHSLFVHDPGTDPAILDALADCDIPRTGVVMTAGAQPLVFEPAMPDAVIVDDVAAVAARTSALFARDMSADVEAAHARLLASGAPVYWLADMDDWIADVYERCTGLAFDPVRYAALANLFVESRFARGLRSGEWDMDGLGRLRNALERAGSRAHAVGC